MSQRQPHRPSIALALLLLALGATSCAYLHDTQNIVVGNAAKQCASAHFLGKRPLKDLVADDSFFGGLLHKHIKIETDEGELQRRGPRGPRRAISVSKPRSLRIGRQRYQTLTARGLGTERVAVYRNDLGCVLLPVGCDPASLKPCDFHVPPAPEPDPLPEGHVPPTVRAKLDAVLDWAFCRSGKKKYQTRAVIVLHRGKIICEAYSDDPVITRDSLLTGWSMSKGVTNAMVGIMVRQGRLKLHEPPDLSEWRNDPRSTITVDQLMRMESGLRFTEPESQPLQLFRWDLTRMLYLVPDMASYAIARPRRHDPGTVWQYKSGTSQILTQIIRRRMADEAEYLAFPYRELFHPLGMTTARFETDMYNNFVGSSYVYATAREWARFGQLYLNDGVWNGRRILPAGWVAETVQPTLIGSKTFNYGAHFWCNGSGRWPELPPDTYMARGVEGQQVSIVPRCDLVAVRLGHDLYGWPVEDFVRRVIDATKELRPATAD